MYKDKNFSPDFFVLGAQKSGTTTIHKLLELSGQVSLPRIKETHFFSNSQQFKKELLWYQKQFNINSNHKIIGEVDPSYLYIKSASQNILKTTNNRLKFIVIFRKPIDRSFSHYQMSLNRGYEKLSFNQAIKIEKKRLSSNNEFDKINFSYIDRSNYCKQLIQYTSKFKESQFLYLNFDDLLSLDKQDILVKKICSFLEINQIDINIEIHENKSSVSKFKFIQNLLYSKNVLKKIGSMLIKNYELKYKLKQKLNRLNTYKKNTHKPIKLDYRELTPDIIDWNNNEVINLQKLTSLKLEPWII